MTLLAKPDSPMAAGGDAALSAIPLGVTARRDRAIQYVQEACVGELALAISATACGDAPVKPGHDSGARRDDSH